MRDWTRYEKAKQLRDAGMTFKAVGAELGVGAQRAREMVFAQERRARRLEAEKENPSIIPWHRGLKYGHDTSLSDADSRARRIAKVFAAMTLKCIGVLLRCQDGNHARNGNGRTATSDFHLRW